MLLAIGVATAGCGSTGPAGSAGSGGSSPAAAGGGASPALAPAASDPGASAPAPSAQAPSAHAPSAQAAASAAPGDLLAAALRPLRAASAFETSVAIDDMVVVTASGRAVGKASETSVTTAGRTVDYVRVPPRAWAREQGQPWVRVDAGTAPAAPLDILSSPATLALTGSGDEPVTFAATYPAGILGLEGDPVTVTISADDAGVTFRYVTTSSGRPMTSTTILRPAGPEPIKSPIP